MTEVATMTPLQRLRAFEDRVLPDAPRPYHGEIETGHGSKYETLLECCKQHRDALVWLCETDAQVSAAAAVLAAAQARRDAAMQRVSATAEHVLVTTQTEQP